MTIERYGFEDKDGNPQSFMTNDLKIAHAYAQERDLKVTAYVFEMTDSELVEDYTGGAE